MNNRNAMTPTRAPRLGPQPPGDGARGAQAANAKYMGQNGSQRKKPTSQTP